MSKASHAVFPEVLQVTAHEECATKTDVLPFLSHPEPVVRAIATLVKSAIG